MKFASITQRLAGLGSDKWAVHIEGKRRAGAGEDLIFLSIGEPDAPPHRNHGRGQHPDACRPL